MLKLLIILFYSFIVCSVALASQCTKVKVCVSDLKESQCPVGETLQYDPNLLLGCCPICRPGLPEAGECRPPACCLPDGSYAPVQCKGDLFTGRCFCSSKAGNRIFGQKWKSNAEGISCACSRRRSELQAEGRPVTLHCTSTGDYEPLQCDNGLCWCAQPKTGQPIVSPVHQKDWKKLYCYCARDTAIYFPDKGMTVAETCESNGNYKTQQNIGDYLYCVD